MRLIKKKKLSLTELNKNSLLQKELESIKGGYWGYGGGSGGSCFGGCTVTGTCGCVCVGEINGDIDPASTYFSEVSAHRSQTTTDNFANAIEMGTNVLLAMC